MKKSENHGFSKKSIEFMTFHAHELENEISKKIISYFDEIKNKNDNENKIFFTIILNALSNYCAYVLAGTEIIYDIDSETSQVMSKFFDAIKSRVHAYNKKRNIKND